MDFCLSLHLGKTIPLTGCRIWGWDTAALIRELGSRGHAAATIDALAAAVTRQAAADDSVLVMSNGGFGGLHEKLLTALRQRFANDPDPGNS